MRHGSLFSGIGGFDLAAEWMGWENIFHCEWNEFGQKVLKHYWPNAESFGDITKTDFKKFNGTIDIISGGFPCQPYSTAGKRKGKEDERHLWPEMFRAIIEIQPGWVVGENVPGLLNWNGGMVLSEIKTDLESAGFEVLPPCILPACGKDAPHRRDRLWIIAHGRSVRFNTGRSEQSLSRYCANGKEIIATNTESPGASIVCNRKEGGIEIRTKHNINGRSDNGYATNTDSRDRETQRQATVLGQPESQRETKGYLFSGNKIEQWDSFPTQPPLCSGNDGLLTELAGITVRSKKYGTRTLNEKQSYGWHRKESIKAYGNSIVPQIVYEIFKAIEQCNKK